MKPLFNHKSDSEFERLTPYSLIKKFANRLFATSLTFGRNLLSHLDSKTRLGLSIMMSMTLFLIIPDSMHLYNRILIGWIVGTFTFLGLVVIMMSSATPQKTCDSVQRQEAQHFAVFLLVIITTCISIFAIGLMQANNKNISASAMLLKVALSLVAVLCSWFLTHTVFALHYATCYYRQDVRDEEIGYSGGLDFPGDELPDYWDFMYFSFTLGMTAQTSDISIPSLFMRRMVLGHAIISFFFYVVILAASVNIASGLI